MKRAPLLGGERREQLSLQIGGHAANPLQCPLAALGQVDRAGAAIVRVGATLGESLGDFCQRKGLEDLLAFADRSAAPAPA